MELPEREQPIDVGVQQEHKRVAERDVCPAHSDESVHQVVNKLKEVSHADVVACGNDRLVLGGAGRRAHNGTD